MPDRSELLGAALFLIPAATAALAKLLYPDISPSDPYADAFFLVATLPIFAYAAYWAFITRRALAVRVYRSQALATELLGLTVWFSIFSVFLLSASPDLRVSQGLTTFAFALILLALFYFADVTVRASRRSDPLLRDTLHWSIVRIPLWVGVIISVGGILAVAAYAAITDNLTLLNDFNTGDFGNTIFNFLFNYAYLLPFVGIVPVAVAWHRAKWDATLRRHFLWLTVALVFLFIMTLVNVGFIEVFLAAGYFLYRAARSLAPMSRLASDREVDASA
jgi:hypothetical protein